MTLRVAFLGLGLMGRPMAENLVRAGLHVTVWNRTGAKTEPLVAAGARAAASPAEAVAEADVAITMLENGPAVTEVLGAFVEALPADALAIDMSSIPPATAREHARLLGERGSSALDAPVSGGTKGATDATLAIMVGGEADDFERARPLLEALGRPTHVGPAGAGQLAKLANQVICAVSIGALAEGLVLAAGGGADPAAVRQAIRGGFAEGRILAEHGQRMVDRDFVPGGPSRMQLKDLETVLATAAELGLELPLARAITELFRALVARGDGELDHSAVLLELERRNDLG